MKILVLHNTYQQQGGEDVAVASELELLRSRGHQVELLPRDNAEISGLAAKLATALRTPYSPPSRERVSEALARIQPDIVHVHNFFPLLSPSIYDACIEARVPVVQTLHNYRTVCANALLLREGKPCELCVHGSPVHGLVHGCYRGSRVATAPVTAMIGLHRRRGTWRHLVNGFIVPSRFGRDKFIEAGFPAEKISVKPNFLADPYEGRTLPPRPRRERPTFLFVGRLSEEKGVRTLLRAWGKVGAELRMIGDGPLMAEVRNAGLANVTVLGHKSRAEVHEELSRADFLVMPSECYETFGLAVIEAYAHGVPALASRLGGLREIVEDTKTGAHFRAGDAQDLAVQANTLMEAPPEEDAEMRLAARAAYLTSYTADINYGELLSIYDRVIQKSH